MINITLINEKKEQLLYDVLIGHGKDGLNISEAVIASVEQEKNTGATIWEKVDTILSDTFSGQINANKRLIEYVKSVRKDPDAIIEMLWCLMHTSSNLDKKGQEGLPARSQQALKEIKMLYGTPKTHGFAKDDIKNEYEKSINS